MNAKIIADLVIWEGKLYSLAALSNILQAFILKDFLLHSYNFHPATGCISALLIKLSKTVPGRNNIRAKGAFLSA